MHGGIIKLTPFLAMTRMFGPFFGDDPCVWPLFLPGWPSYFFSFKSLSNEVGFYLGFLPNLSFSEHLKFHQMVGWRKNAVYMHPEMCDIHISLINPNGSRLGSWWRHQNLSKSWSRSQLFSKTSSDNGLPLIFYVLQFSFRKIYSKIAPFWKK